MQLTTVLFDLDGTLLPMDQDEFIKDYFVRIAHTMAGHGYDPKAFLEALHCGVRAVMENDGSKTNEEIFWEAAVAKFGEKILLDKPLVDRFYETDFAQCKGVCGVDPSAAALVHKLREKGFRVVLATNPVFPALATHRRIRWAGLEPEDFELITTYENASFCKPSLNYYRQILEKLQLQPEDCLMVGNDVGDDMAAAGLGMKVFLLTDCLINRKNEDISRYPYGGFGGLDAFIDTL